MDTEYINLKFKIYIKDGSTYYLTPNSKFFEDISIENIADDNNGYDFYTDENTLTDKFKNVEKEKEPIQGGKRMINNHKLRKTLKKLKRKINKTLRVI